MTLIPKLGGATVISVSLIRVLSALSPPQHYYYSSTVLEPDCTGSYLHMVVCSNARDRSARLTLLMRSTNSVRPRARAFNVGTLRAIWVEILLAGVSSYERGDSM